MKEQKKIRIHGTTGGIKLGGIDMSIAEFFEGIVSDEKTMKTFEGILSGEEPRLASMSPTMLTSVEETETDESSI